jgi:multicomponent K+:H+ antiporter subunit F
MNAFTWSTLASGAVAPIGPAQPSPAEPLLMFVVNLGMLTLVVGMILALYRLLKGPHLADRVLSGDVLALHVVGLVALLTIRMRTLAFFDAALVVAIIGFASTLAFAQYIGTRRLRRS